MLVLVLVLLRLPVDLLTCTSTSTGMGMSMSISTSTNTSIARSMMSGTPVRRRAANLAAPPAIARPVAKFRRRPASRAAADQPQ